MCTVRQCLQHHSLRKLGVESGPAMVHEREPNSKGPEMLGDSRFQVTCLADPNFCNWRTCSQCQEATRYCRMSGQHLHTDHWHSRANPASEAHCCVPYESTELHGHMALLQDLPLRSVLNKHCLAVAGPLQPLSDTEGEAVHD